MENQVQTIICPNCGANATNHHNCEYCGSYLIQRAIEGKDVSAYVHVAKNYYNQGLASALKLYSNLLQEHPTENSLQFIVNNTVNLIANNYDSKVEDNQNNTGFLINLSSSSLEDDGVLGKFKNLPLLQAFNKSSVKSWNGEGQVIEETEYSLDFGYDYEGASKVVLQLLELYGMNIEESTFRIYDGGPDLAYYIASLNLSASDVEKLGLDSSDKDLSGDCLVFNASGVIIEDFVSFNQSGWQGIEERRMRRNEKFKAALSEKNLIKKGCAWMFALLLMVGSGVSFGLVELVKVIFS